MIRPDRDFFDLMLSSSCFGQEVCPLAPCACAQTLINRSVEMLVDRLADHYWDSLEPNKDLILRHVRGAVAAEANEDLRRGEEIALTRDETK